MPLPVTWLGRQAKGCAQMMLATPLSMSSRISAISSQPSPAWLPREVTWPVSRTSAFMSAGGMNRPAPARRIARRAGTRYRSMTQRSTRLLCRAKRSTPRWSASSITRAARSATVVAPGSGCGSTPVEVPPWPGRSQRITRWVRASAPVWASQTASEVPSDGPSSRTGASAPATAGPSMRWWRSGAVTRSPVRWRSGAGRGR